MSPQHLDILRTWAEHGIPFDRGTVAYAQDVITAAVNHIDRLGDVIDQLTGGDTA